MLIHTPWSQEQVDALNAYQHNGRFHPYTCPNPHPTRVLFATLDGWVCPHCAYTQGWALQSSIQLGSQS